MKVLDACHEKTGQMEADFGSQDVELVSLEVSVLIFTECGTERYRARGSTFQSMEMLRSQVRAVASTAGIKVTTANTEMRKSLRVSESDQPSCVPE